MIAERMKKPWRLLAVLLLALALFTACSSKAEKTQEKAVLGQKYLTELNYTEAVASFTEAIGLDPENIPAYMGRAQAYVGLEQYEEAKADYTTVIEKTEDQPYTQAEAYVGRAEVNELTTDTTAAENDCSSAIGLLDADDVGKKENIAETLIRELKIRVLQMHAELCMKLGLYDKAIEDYAKLAELGVDMSEENSGAQATEENLAGGPYVWTNLDPEGHEEKKLLMVQPGSNRLDAVADYPTDVLGAEEIAGTIASAKIENKYPEIVRERWVLIDEYNNLISQTDSQNASPELMARIEAVSEQLDALDQKYSFLENEYDAEVDKWFGVDWRSNTLESIVLSNPVTRVEKTADTLYIYVPTGTKYQSVKMTFTSYSGIEETFDETPGITQDIFEKPIYELEYNGGVTAGYNIVYKEDK